MQRRDRRPSKGPLMEGFTRHNDRFCFSCENIFTSKLFLEEHCCPAATHICSCGTEFPLYSDMVAHSKTHQPGHSVVDHKAVRRRRFDREQEETLRLSAEQGPSSLSFITRPASSLEVVSKYQVPMQSSPPNSMNISKLLRRSAAPTVDLWTIYQPVVLMKTHTFKNKGTYSCGKCLQSFSTKSNLVLHYNTHAKDSVFGCIGCGVLLSSSKSLPRYHRCGSPGSSLEAGVITTRPVCGQKPNMAPVAQTLMPSNKSKELNVTPSKTTRLNTFTRPHSNPLKMPMRTTFAMNAFSCGVCRVVFESVKLLQRHKCIEAQRIVLSKAPPRPQSSTQRRSIAALKSPYPLPQTARSRNHSVALCGVTAYQHKTAVLGSGPGGGRPGGGPGGGQPVSQEVDLDSDDDCYIIENSTIKPNKMLCSL